MFENTNLILKTQATDPILVFVTLASLLMLASMYLGIIKKKEPSKKKILFVKIAAAIAVLAPVLVSFREIPEELYASLGKKECASPTYDTEKVMRKIWNGEDRIITSGEFAALERESDACKEELENLEWKEKREDRLFKIKKNQERYIGRMDS